MMRSGGKDIGTMTTERTTEGVNNPQQMFKAVQQPERLLDRPGRPQVEFETWIQLFDAYACVSGLNECPENLRRNTFVL